MTIISFDLTSSILSNIQNLSLIPGYDWKVRKLVIQAHFEKTFSMVCSYALSIIIRHTIDARIENNVQFWWRTKDDNWIRTCTIGFQWLYVRLRDAIDKLVYANECRLPGSLHGRAVHRKGAGFKSAQGEWAPRLSWIDLDFRQTTIWRVSPKTRIYLEIRKKSNLSCDEVHRVPHTITSRICKILLSNAFICSDHILAHWQQTVRGARPNQFWRLDDGRGWRVLLRRRIPSSGELMRHSPLLIAYRMNLVVFCRV